MTLNDGGFIPIQVQLSSASYIICFVPETSLIHHTNVLDVPQFLMSNVFSPPLKSLAGVSVKCGPDGGGWRIEKCG